MKKTKIFNIDIDNIDVCKLEKAAEIIRTGGTVAFPTETVYGLGANALDENAVKKIFKAKGRPSDNPLIVHISNLDEVKDLSNDIPNAMESLASRFWPGPLTMIINKGPNVPDIITAGLNTVAIRLPSHPIAKLLIELAGVPVAAPSANISGKPSPTNGEHVVEDLMGRVDGIVCGGDAEVGVESTVLDITCTPPMILRPGGITRDELEEVIDKVDIDPGIIRGYHEESAPKSPGMKYVHYSPNAEVIVVRGSIQEMIKKIEELVKQEMEAGKRVGIMATKETKDIYTNGKIISVGSRQNLDTIATNLFKVLRDFDKESVDIIFAEAFEEKGIGEAVMNRLTKAAGYNIIEV